MDAFAEKLGPYLSDNLDSTHFAQLFMKIDADCGGTIDWYESCQQCRQSSKRFLSYVVDHVAPPFLCVFGHVVLPVICAVSTFHRGQSPVLQLSILRIATMACQ
jgi:hypothetical protein